MNLRFRMRDSIKKNKKIDERQLESVNDLDIKYNLFNRAFIREKYGTKQFSDAMQVMDFESGYIRVSENKWFQIWADSKTLKVNWLLWKIVEATRMDNRSILIVYSNNFRLGIKVAKDVHLNKIETFISYIKDNTPKYFDVSPMVICDPASAKSTIDEYEKIAAGWKYQALRIKMFGKERPKFFQKLGHLRYETNIQNKPVIKIFRRKSLDILTKLEIDPLMIGPSKNEQAQEGQIELKEGESENAEIVEGNEVSSGRAMQAEDAKSNEISNIKK